MFRGICFPHCIADLMLLSKIQKWETTSLAAFWFTHAVKKMIPEMSRLCRNILHSDSMRLSFFEGYSSEIEIAHAPSHHKYTVAQHTTRNQQSPSSKHQNTVFSPSYVFINSFSPTYGVLTEVNTGNVNEIIYFLF